MYKITYSFATGEKCDVEIVDKHIQEAINNAKTELKRTEEKLAELSYGIDNQQGTMKKLDFHYDQFQGWADEFDKASLEQKKMIICQLVREINVSKGYELEIVLDVNYEQFFVIGGEIQKPA